MSTAISNVQEQLIEEFNYFDNWLDKYEYIIELGRQLSAYPLEWQCDEYRVSGCQAQVWIRPRMENNKLYFDATSDAAIVKGLICMLLKIYSGQTPQEILNTKPTFIEAIGLDKHLSPTRSNGLYHMLEKIGEYAKKERENL